MSLPAAIARLNDDMRAYDAWLTTYDVILSPVLGKPPVELGYVAGWGSVPRPPGQAERLCRLHPGAERRRRARP
ncbi:hypothetical protein ACRAWD_11680 [Caulobacter segnis]